MTPKTSLPEIAWPPISDPHASVLLSLLFQLQQSQWWTPKEIQEQQFRQLNALMAHAWKTVPYYHQHLRAAGLSPDEALTPRNWRQVPVLTSDALRNSPASIRSKHIPAQHGKIVNHKTSGSTGKALTIPGTEVTALFWLAFTLRDHIWHERDVSGKLVAIRSGRDAEDPNRVYTLPSWGIASNLVFNTGPSVLFYHLLPIERQAELLLEHDPDYLLVYPDVILRLAFFFRKHQLRLPNLKQIMTYGEAATPEVRTVCSKVWGVKTKDTYSAEEVGYIALQCPETDNYHVQSESLLLEVIDDKGGPCGLGETVRIIITALHNFALPLIRYEIGDYAEVGKPCPCGRGLPTLKRILGRERNRAILPDGRRLWPNLSGNIWCHIRSIEQIQIIQKTETSLDVRVVSKKALNKNQEKSLTKSLHQTFGYPFECSFSYVGKISRHANGKFEPFISELTE